MAKNNNYKAETSRVTTLTASHKEVVVTQSVKDILSDKLLGKKILFVTDEKIWQNCAKFFPKNFLEQNRKNLILKNPKPDLIWDFSLNLL